MIAILLILSFLVTVITAGYLLKETLSDMLPFVWCILIAVLYLLAFGRLLNLIDVILPLCAIALLVLIIRRGRGEMRSFTQYMRENLLSAGFITYLILCVSIPILLSSRIVTWWDDINYWASDLKSLYHMGGFAAKYANVSSAFGDYPPGVQLAKWFTVHMDKRGFKESLAFAGYYLFNLSFIMPLFKRIKGVKVCLSPVFAIAAWAFAGIGDIYFYSGFCADVAMAFLFGSILIETVGEDKPLSVLCVFKTSLLMGVLVIAKSTGMIWAFFALIIWIGYNLSNMTHVTKKDVLRTFSVIIGPALFGISWMGFCLLHRRVTQTTSTMVTYLTTDKYGLSPYKNEFGQAFVKAFFTEPVHVNHTWIDLPPAFMFALICLALILLRCFGILKGRAGTYVCIALPVMGLVYYVLIYIAHLTIFATETQYLDAEGMIASIERYGAPYVIGCMLFIAWMWMNRTETDLRIRVLLLSVLLLTNVPEAFNGLIGYRTSVDEARKAREAFIDDLSREFLNVLTDEDLMAMHPAGTRVCRVRDGAYYRVSDAYVAYEASPVSVISVSYDVSDMNAEFFTQAVSETHASYVYVDWQPYEDTFLNDMVKDGIFEYGKMYRILYEEGQMKLE